MISLTDSNLIILAVLELFAFIFSITLAGTIQAQISRWRGDETAVELGFGDFNPFVHIQFIDIIFFALLRLMLGRPIPINGNNFSNKNKIRSFVIVFASRPIIHILVSVIAVFMRAFLINISGGSMIEQRNSFFFLLSNFSQYLSLINALLAGFCIIRESVYGFVSYKYSQDARFIEYANPIMIFGVLFLLIIFGGLIMNGTEQIITIIVQKLAHLLQI
jgi:hypothetical protein